MVVVRILFLMLLGGMISCGSGNWSPEDQNEFLDECAEEGGSRSYCNCYLEQVMEHYPNPADADAMDFETAVELADKCE